MSYLVDETYRDAACQFRFVILESNLLALARFSGKGTIEGTREFARMLDESTKVLPAGGRVRAIADLSGLSKTPLRAQFILGKWLFSNRALCGRIAIFGAAAWERHLAKATFKIARLKDIQFFKGEAEAKRYMETAAELPELANPHA